MLGYFKIFILSLLLLFTPTLVVAKNFCNNFYVKLYNNNTDSPGDLGFEVLHPSSGTSPLNGSIPQNGSQLITFTNDEDDNGVRGNIQVAAVGVFEVSGIILQGGCHVSIDTTNGKIDNGYVCGEFTTEKPDCKDKAVTFSNSVDTGCESAVENCTYSITFSGS